VDEGKATGGLGTANYGISEASQAYPAGLGQTVFMILGVNNGFSDAKMGQLFSYSPFLYFAGKSRRYPAF